MKTGTEIGSFRSFAEWVNKANQRTYQEGTVFLDARRRQCRTGADFMRARDDGAFPVRYFAPVPAHPSEEV
jgi:hypothetical protein